MKKSHERQAVHAENAKARQPYVSRRQAAMMLGVVPTTIDKLAAANGLTVKQIPGHGRRHFLRAEIDSLAARSVNMDAADAGQEARA